MSSGASSFLRFIVGTTRKLPRRRGATRLMVLLLSVYSLTLSALLATVWRGRKPGKLVDADVLGFNMTLNIWDFADCAFLFFPEIYEWREIAFLEEHLRPGDVFLDAGAHIGFYSLVAGKAVGHRGVVMAMEADPDIYERLCFSLRSNAMNNVRPLNVGVSDSRATLHLGIVAPPLRSSSSFLNVKGQGFDVPCLPLLEILQENGIRTIKGAKFDIEGFEFRVLSRFLQDADSSLLPEFIIVEVNPHLVGKAGGDPVALLKNHGYRVYMKTWLNYVMIREERLEGSAAS